MNAAGTWTPHEVSLQSHTFPHLESAVMWLAHTIQIVSSPLAASCVMPWPVHDHVLQLQGPLDGASTLPCTACALHS